MSTSREITGEDLKVLEKLFDSALTKYGIEDKKFVNLSAAETNQLKDVVVEFIQKNTEATESNYARSADPRVYNNYRKELRRVLYGKSFSDEVIVSDNDKVQLTDQSKVGCSESMINSVVLYVTNKEQTSWPLYRSNSKVGHAKEKNEVESEEKQKQVFEINIVNLPNSIDQEKEPQSTHNLPGYKKLKKKLIIFITGPLVIILGYISFVKDMWDINLDPSKKKIELTTVQGEFLDGQGKPIPFVEFYRDEVIFSADSLGRFQISTEGFQEVPPYEFKLLDTIYHRKSISLSPGTHRQKVQLRSLP